MIYWWREFHIEMLYTITALVFFFFGGGGGEEDSLLLMCDLKVRERLKVYSESCEYYTFCGNAWNKGN